MPFHFTGKLDKVVVKIEESKLSDAERDALDAGKARSALAE